MVYKGYEIRACNCGGPQYGTDHSPDCQMLLDALDVEQIIEDLEFFGDEQEEVDHAG